MFIPLTQLRRVCTIFLFTLVMEGAQSCLAPDMVWRMRSVSDPQLAPDGKSIVYVESWNDAMDDAGYSNLWQISIGGGPIQALTEGKRHDNSPRWSPDGAWLAYVSDRSGKSAIHIRGLATGEDRAISEGAESISNLAWSPDGKFVAYMAFASSASGWSPAMPAKPAGRLVGRLRRRSRLRICDGLSTASEY